MNPTKSLRFEIVPGEAGERIDKIVVRHAGALGRRRTAELFAAGAVRVGGRRAKKGDRAREGDVVTIEEPARDIEPEPGAPLDVRLETDTVVVASKPAGQPTAPIHPGETHTLAQALLGRYPEMAGIGYRPREPGLVHRLDTQTSGLVVAARTGVAFDHLRRALGEGRLDKRYFAVVEEAGLPESGVIERPLGPDPGNPRRVAVVSKATARDKQARTEFRTLRICGRWALLEVHVRHAYRHQIRAHLASEGHPIAGDALYGGPSVPGLGTRHALHACYVAWAGDDVVGPFAVEDPLPEDLAALLGAS